jgi:hypothetical protein
MRLLTSAQPERPGIESTKVHIVVLYYIAYRAYIPAYAGDTTVHAWNLEIDESQKGTGGSVESSEWENDDSGCSCSCGCPEDSFQTISSRIPPDKNEETK